MYSSISYDKAKLENYFFQGGTSRKKSLPGSFFYESLNHLGNVQVVVSDKRISVCDEELEVDYFKADVLLAMDYYPFGMMMPDRQWYANSDTGIYKFAFNGKEIDREHGGAGNVYDYGFRIYNPALGKFLSVDPLSSSYPWYTPYQFAGNKVMWAVDLDGLEPITFNGVLDQYEILQIEGLDGSVLNNKTFFKNKKSGATFSFDHTGMSTQVSYVDAVGYKKARQIQLAAEIFRYASINRFAARLTNERLGLKEGESLEGPGAAETYTNTLNDISGGPLGKTFRHYASQAYFTIRYNTTTAKTFGDTYERMEVNPDDARNFDLINNERGREIGKELNGRFDLTTAEGVAGFLNEVVNIVRKEEGLDPLPADKPIFTATDSLVIQLVIPAENEGNQ